MFETLNDEPRLRRYIAIALALLLGIGVVFMIGKTINEFRLSSASVGEVQNTITVSGSGEAIAVPDTATFSFTIIEEATTVAPAQEALSKKIDSVLAMLKKEKIGEGDIKTINYNINPKYDYDSVRMGMPCSPYSCPPYGGDPKIVGYQVSQTIEVKVKSLDKAPTLLSNVGSLGVTSVSGIYFSVSNQKDFEREARQKAINEAKVKAEQLAKDLGMRLGKVVSFSENGYYPYPMRYESFGKGADAVAPTPAPQVPAGENKITSQVQITYEIK